MDFEQLKQGWQQQHAPPVQLGTEAQTNLMARVNQVRRHYVRQNILVSVILLAVVGVTGWIWSLYSADFSWKFDLSLFLLNILLLLTIGINWYKTAAWHRYNFASSTQDFLAHLIKKLRFIKWLSYTGSLIYSVLLWGIMALYIVEVGRPLGGLALAGILTALTLWAALSYWWGRRHQKKKDARFTNPLLAELEALQKQLM